MPSAQWQCCCGDFRSIIARCSGETFYALSESVISSGAKITVDGDPLCYTASVATFTSAEVIANGWSFLDPAGSDWTDGWTDCEDCSGTLYDNYCKVPVPSQVHLTFSGISLISPCWRGGTGTSRLFIDTGAGLPVLNFSTTIDLDMTTRCPGTPGNAFASNLVGSNSYDIQIYTHPLLQNCTGLLGERYSATGVFASVRMVSPGGLISWNINSTIFATVATDKVGFSFSGLHQTGCACNTPGVVSNTTNPVTSGRICGEGGQVAISFTT